MKYKNFYRPHTGTTSLVEIETAKSKVNTAIQKNDTFRRYLVDSVIFKEIQSKMTDEYLYLEKPNLQQLYIQMIEEYHYYPIEAYPDLLKKTFDNFYHDFQNAKTIVLLPVITSDTLKGKKIKSSNLIQYLFQSNFIKTYSKKINFERKYSYSSKELQLCSDKRIFILIDDFIGTGQSVIESYNYWRRRGAHIGGIASLVTSQQGKENILSAISNTQLYFGEEVTRFSNFHEVDLLLKSLNIKQSKNDFCIGVLVTMARTPNNTIPLFYKNGRKNGVKLDAPFLR